MTETKRPLKVFLCHAHADTLRALRRNPVRGLYTRLIKDGVDAWLDKEKLLPPRAGFQQAQPTRLGIGNPQGCARECIIYSSAKAGNI